MDQSGLRGARSAPASPSSKAGSAGPWRSAVSNCRRRPGGRSRWPRAARVPRSCRFSAQRVRPTSRRQPGAIHWAVYRRNRYGSEPRYYLSNAPEDTPPETLAYVGGSRWRIETEFETEQSDVGLDEYAARTEAGWHHHITMCLLAGAFLLSLQQDWGKRCPGSPGRRFTGWSDSCCSGTVRTG